MDVNIGLGVSTGGGVKDDSFSIKALGTGFTIGRKLGLSFLDNEIALDLGKLFATNMPPQDVVESDEEYED